MPCEPTVLYQNANGAVMRCPDCNLTQLAFGTSHFILQSSEFNQLRRKLKKEIAEAQICKGSSQKRFSIPLKDHCTRLWLTGNELTELHNIMEQAAWMGAVMHTLND